MTEQGNQEKKPSKIKAAAKFLFDLPAWVGADNIRDNTSWLSALIKKTFRLPAPRLNTSPESFAAVAERFGVSPEDLRAQGKRFLLSSLMFLGLAILSLFYIAYLFSHSSLLVSFVTLIVFALFAVRAYFYSFWYFQIQQKRLDCSFKEWLIWLFRGRVV